MDINRPTGVPDDKWTFSLGGEGTREKLKVQKYYKMDGSKHVSGD